MPVLDIEKQNCSLHSIKGRLFSESKLKVFHRNIFPRDSHQILQKHLLVICIKAR